MIGTIFTVILSFSVFFALHTYCKRTGVFYTHERNTSKNPRTDGNR